MLPLVGLAVSVLPDLARWVFGDQAEKPVAAVTSVISRLVGTDDPQAVSEALANNPGLVTELRVELAKISAESERTARAAELETLKAELADVASARSQQVSLAQLGSGTQWAPSIVSVLIVATFMVMGWLVITQTIPVENKDAAMLILGSLSTFVGAVVNFWLGSSRGSAMKDSRMGELISKISVR